MENIEYGKSEYYSDYFKAMRKDIITRVNTHTKFVMQKIVTIFLLSRKRYYICSIIYEKGF